MQLHRSSSRPTLIVVWICLMPMTVYAQPSPDFAPLKFSPAIPVSAYVANEPLKVFAWVAGKIEAVPGKPDQFSTAGERQKYADEVAAQTAGIGQIPLVLPCRPRYQPDRQAFEIKVDLQSVRDGVPELGPAKPSQLRKLLIGTTNMKVDTYVGNNAYGATSQVTRRTADMFYLSFPIDPEHVPSSVLTRTDLGPQAGQFRYLDDYAFTLSAPMAPPIARENAMHLACLFVFSLEAPYIIRVNERHFPKRDLPDDITINGFALFGRLDQIAVMHKVSGELFDQAARGSR